MKWFVLILFFGGLAPLNADANCPTNAPILKGTIPVDGQVDVPIDTVFAVFTQAFAQAEIEGVELQAQGGSYKTWTSTSNLEPDTDYQIVYTLDGDFEDQRVEVVVGFRTGTELASKASAPEVAGYQIIDSAEIQDEVCREFVIRTSCSDQGEPTFVHFNTPDSRDLLIVNIDRPFTPQIWPSSCGTPAWQGYGGRCFNVHAFENGNLSEPTEVCGPPLEPKQSSTEGCSQTNGGPGPSLLLLFGLGWLYRRRS